MTGCAGEKLIDHLKKWLEPEKLVAVPCSWEAGQEAVIAGAILDLFHLLPSQAVKFLETGVLSHCGPSNGLLPMTALCLDLQCV